MCSVYQISALCNVFKYIDAIMKGLNQLTCSTNAQSMSMLSGVTSPNVLPRLMCITDVGGSNAPYSKKINLLRTARIPFYVTPTVIAAIEC